MPLNQSCDIIVIQDINIINGRIEHSSSAKRDKSRNNSILMYPSLFIFHICYYFAISPTQNNKNGSDV